MTQETVESLSSEAPQEKLPAQPWSSVAALRGSRLASLIGDYKDLEAEEADIEVRKQAMRDLIAEEVSKVPFAVKVGDKRVEWVPAGKESWTPDKTLMVRAGYTPDQIRAVSRKNAGKKAHLKISPIQEEITAVVMPRLDAPTPSTSPEEAGGSST